MTSFVCGTVIYCLLHSAAAQGSDGKNTLFPNPLFPSLASPSHPIFDVLSYFFTELIRTFAKRNAKWCAKWVNECVHGFLILSRFCSLVVQYVHCLGSGEERDCFPDCFPGKLDAGSVCDTCSEVCKLLSLFDGMGTEKQRFDDGKGHEE